MSDSICSITTLRAPLEQVRAWTSYHLNLGVSRMYLYFDDPADPAVDALADNPRLTCIRCDEQHWPGGRKAREKLTLPQRQWFNAKDAWRRAGSEGHDWLLHFDCDELIRSPVPLPELLSATSRQVDVLRFRTLEAVPDRLHYEDPFQQVNCFKVGPCRPTRRCYPGNTPGIIRALAATVDYYTRLHSARIIAPRAFRNGQYLRGHLGGKSAVRVTSRVKAVGVHVPVPAVRHLNAEFVNGGGLLHFDGCDYQAWRDKWLKRFREKSVPPSRGANRAWQMQLFSQAFESGDERQLTNLFEQQYFLPEEVRGKLLSLGLLRMIQSEGASFESGNCPQDRLVADREDAAVELPVHG